MTNVNSIYSKVKKRRVKRRVGLPYAGEFSRLPQVKRYNARVPVGFRGGWYGNFEGHREARLKGYYSGALKHKNNRTTYVTPEAVRLSPRFQGEEFALNQPKFSLTRGAGRFAENASNINKSYDQLRAEARARNAYVPPTLREAGYSAKYVTPENVSFYATKTGQAIKGTLSFLKARKIKKEQEAKEKLYAQAQNRAEKARIEQLELQSQLSRKKVNELRKQNGLEQIYGEVKGQDVQEQNKGLLGKLFKKKEIPQKFKESKEQIEKDYASV